MSSVTGVVSKEDESPQKVETRDRDLVLWQRRMLPFMTWFIVAMATAFFLFSALHLYSVTMFIQTEHGQDIRTLIETELGKPSTAAPTLGSEDTMRRSILLLEGDALDKRYHLASAMLVSRIWSRQLAFITGMVMAFVGAVFILGKLSEGVSQVSGGVADWKVAITSASPGIILGFFATVLLVATLYVPATPLGVTDGPAYLPAMRPTPKTDSTPSQPGKSESQTKPMTLEEFNKLSKEKSGSTAKQQ
jgi:hypothetical protein